MIDDLFTMSEIIQCVAVAVLLLGYSAEDTTDATSSASVRNDMADKVSIIK